MSRIVVKPATGKLMPQVVLGESVRTLASGEDTGSFEVFLQSGDEGIGPPPHHHPWDEAYYVLEGQLEVFCAGETQVLGSGGFAFLPAGTVHAYKGVNGPARFISVTSSPGASRFFTEVSSEAPELPPDLAKIMPIALRNRITPDLPPGMP